MKIQKREKSKIYQPKSVVAPLYTMNVITDNYTDEHGDIINKSPENAVEARRWSKENKQ